MSDSSKIAGGAPRLINLADERLGAVTVSATDEFFAPLSRLLNAKEPQWREGVYDDNGKWMDGWETRRRRAEGNDHCVIRLAAPGVLCSLDIDTRFFTGNFPPRASVAACRCDGTPGADMRWTTILPSVPLEGNRQNLFQIDSPEVWTHLRLDIYPDGGVARLRAYGKVHRIWGADDAAVAVDLAAALNGGTALACSDEHYGTMTNILLPGRASSMADGWETRRRREPGFDWVILRLGHAGKIERIELDTAYFKGNFPHQVSIHGALLPANAQIGVTAACLYWPVLLEPQPMRADAVHQFTAELRDLGPISHVRVNMHPDGGLSRVRLFGRPAIA